MCKLYTLVAFLAISVNAQAQTIFTTIDTNDGLSDNQVLSIIQLDDGRMGITTLGNFNIFNGASFDYVHYNDETSLALPFYHGAYHVYLGHDGLIWIKDYSSLKCFDLVRSEYRTDLTKLLKQYTSNADQIKDIFLDSDRNIWGVTEKGIWNPKTKSYLPDYEKNLEVQDIETTNDTTLVFYNTGLIKAYEVATSRLIYTLESYDKVTAEMYKHTSLVKILPDGNMLQIRTGHDNNQQQSRSILLYIDPAKRQIKKLLEVPAVLHTIGVQDSDVSYITSQTGLWKILPRQGKCDFIDSINTLNGTISSEKFNTIFIDSQGGIWLGTYTHGLLYAHNARFSFKSVKDLSSIGIQQSDLIKKAVTPNLPKELTDKYKFNDSYTDSRGYLWVATNDGLRLYTGPNDYHTYYTEDGLCNNQIKAIIEDRNGTVWVSTASGISSIGVKIVDKKPELTITEYDVYDGAEPSEYLKAEAYYLSDGRIVFKAISGWTVIDPDNLPDFKSNLKPIFSKILVNGIEVKGLTNLDLNLSYRQNNIGLEIASLNYVHPNNSSIRFRILMPNSSDDSWTLIPVDGPGKSSVVRIGLSNLAIGEYVVEIAPGDLDTVDEEYITRLKVRINAPWWRTTVAWCIYTILFFTALIGAWLVYRARIRRNHREELMLTRIRSLVEQCQYYQERENKTDDNSVKCAPEVVTESSQSALLSDNDKEFINKAIKLVEEHIDTNYNVAQLSQDLCMDRTGLYKKMTALLDKSPSIFIRSIRLQHVATLLETTDKSIAEIAEITGFSSASHLRRTFTEHYGMSPTEYASSNRSH